MLPAAFVRQLANECCRSCPAGFGDALWQDYCMLLATSEHHVVSLTWGPCLRAQLLKPRSNERKTVTFIAVSCRIGPGRPRVCAGGPLVRCESG